MYRCLIIDDEPIAIRVIKTHLSAFSDFKVVGEFSSAVEAIQYLKGNQVDLMFCDIKMPQISGLDFVRSLSSPPRVIFTTAYRDYAVEAFELKVVDYLLKPVSFARFTKAIGNFLDIEQAEHKETGNTKSNELDHIFLKADKKHHKIQLTDVIYVESMGDYVVVYLDDKKIVSKEKLGNMLKLLPVQSFLQIHRSYIVSLDKIDAIGSGFVEIKKKKLPVGRSYKSSLLNLLHKS